MQAILRDWSLFRALRVGLGVFILIQGILIKDTFSIVMGLSFGGMALFNIGCCGSGGCATPSSYAKNSKTPTGEIEYEEVTDTK